MNKNKEIRLTRTIGMQPSELRVREAAEGSEPSRVIEGYAILFNTPSAPLWEDEDTEAREVISPEAITKELLDDCDIKFTMYHDRHLILGRSNKGSGTLSYFVDDKGVGFSLELPKSPNGDEALELVRRGDLAGCSFAFTTYYFDPAFVSSTLERVEGKTKITYTVNVITGVYDFTLTADPAYPDTSVEARELRECIHPIDPKEDAKRDIAGQIAEMRRESKRTIQY